MNTYNPVEKILGKKLVKDKWGKNKEKEPPKSACCRKCFDPNDDENTPCNCLCHER